jgi:hypothetical protein
MSAHQFVRASVFPCWLFGLLFGGFPCLLRAVPAAKEPLLELPKITVTDLRTLPPPEAWRYAQVSGLEILSAVPDRETQKLLRDFHLFNDALGVVWPALKEHQSVPISLILCGTEKQFSAFLPLDAETDGTGRASLLLKDAEQASIILNFGVKSIDLAPADVEPPPPPPDGGLTPPPDVVGATMQVDYHRQLYREYVRYLLSFNQPRLPAWLEEGLAQLLMSMKVDPKFIEFARIEDPALLSVTSKFASNDLLEGAPSTTHEEQDFNSSLRSRGLIPLAEFFAVGHDSLEANNPIAGKWSKQAQALVHMWLYGEGKKFNQGFARFVARATQEPVTEAMFKECFKMSYSEMLTALRIYIGDTAYQHQQFEAKKGGGLPEPAPLALRDATDAEVGRIKGEAQVLAGHLELAHDEMRAPYARGVTDGPLLASMGLLEKQRGEPVRARKFLEAAAQKQVVRPRAYLELATLRLDQAQPVSSEPAARLTAAQTQAVMQPLQTARLQQPPTPEVYELMAEVWLRSEVRPSSQDIALLNQSVMHFQRRPVLLLRTAELNVKYGDPAAARAMADFGLKLARTPEARQAFEEVKASLPPVPGK